jgi:hypothetical protein
MRTLAAAALLGLLLLVMIQPVFAGNTAGVAAPDGGVSVSVASPMPLLFAQSSSDSSSSDGSTHIPRGLIRLAVLGAIGIFSAGTWFVRKVTGS